MPRPPRKPTEPPASIEVQWYGHRARYTGHTETIAKGFFYELELLDGHRKGQFVLTVRPPNEALAAYFAKATHEDLATLSPAERASRLARFRQIIANMPTNPDAQP